MLLAPFNLSTFAENFSTQCPDIQTCVKAVSELTGDKYIFDAESIKGKGNATANLELNRENAVNLFSNLLHMNGYSRVPTGEPDTFRIMRENDAKGTAVPSFTSTLTQPPKLPNNWDIVRLEYKMTHPEGVRHLENVMRTYAPMGARIYGDELNGTILISASALELKGLYPMLQSNDQKVSAEVLKRWKDNAEAPRPKKPHEDPKNK